MNDLDALLDTIIALESGYSNNPNDAGGETIWGITEAVARANGYTEPMIQMTRVEAKAIYLKRYIQDPGFDKVFAANKMVGSELIDTGINMGVAYSAMAFQRILNAFNRGGKDYPDIVDDGDIGPATIKAFDAFMQKRGAVGIAVMMKALNSLQGARYIEITEKRPANEEFVFGWFRNRITI